jgi:hypothetical protein
MALKRQDRHDGAPSFGARQRQSRDKHNEEQRLSSPYVTCHFQVKLSYLIQPDE